MSPSSARSDAISRDEKPPPPRTSFKSPTGIRSSSVARDALVPDDHARLPDIGAVDHRITRPEGARRGRRRPRLEHARRAASPEALAHLGDHGVAIDVAER